VRHTKQAANVHFRQNIKPHKAYTKSELDKIYRIAENHSAAMLAMVHLLYDGALRIQDAVGLTFGDITKVKLDASGYRHIDIVGKKTYGRRISIRQPVYDAVKKYQDYLGAEDSKVMFEPGAGTNPINPWVMKVHRCFKKAGIDVQSHDFRTSRITDLYNSSKNVV
jgi:integrase